MSTNDPHEQVLNNPSTMFRRYGKGRLLALDIATGLAFLHAHGIIHFDIKSRCGVAHELQM